MMLSRSRYVARDKKRPLSKQMYILIQNKR